MQSIVQHTSENRFQQPFITKIMIQNRDTMQYTTTHRTATTATHCNAPRDVLVWLDAIKWVLFMKSAHFIDQSAHINTTNTRKEACIDIIVCVTYGYRNQTLYLMDQQTRTNLTNTHTKTCIDIIICVTCAYWNQLHESINTHKYHTHT